MASTADLKTVSTFYLKKKVIVFSWTQPLYIQSLQYALKTRHKTYYINIIIQTDNTPYKKKIVSYELRIHITDSGAD